MIVAIDNGTHGGIAWACDTRTCLHAFAVAADASRTTALKHPLAEALDDVQVYIERPWGGRGAKALRQQLGMWLEACRYLGVPAHCVHLVYPVQWQSKVLPRGIKDTKAASVAVCRGSGIEPATHDVADAVCILKWALVYAEPARIAGQPLCKSVGKPPRTARAKRSSDAGGGAKKVRKLVDKSKVPAHSTNTAPTKRGSKRRKES